MLNRLKDSQDNSKHHMYSKYSHARRTRRPAVYMYMYYKSRSVKLIVLDTCSLIFSDF